MSESFSADVEDPRAPWPEASKVSNGDFFNIFENVSDIPLSHRFFHGIFFTFRFGFLKSSKCSSPRDGAVLLVSQLSLRFFVYINS